MEWKETEKSIAHGAISNPDLYNLILGTIAHVHILLQK